MEQKMDRRVRKTKAHIRSGLAKLMQTKNIKEITVKDLVDEVDINRSTFYLHYTDIFDLLKKTEDELLNDIGRAIREHPFHKNDMEASMSFFKDVFTTVAENKEIISALIGENGELSFMHRLEEIIRENTMPFLTKMFFNADNDLKYFYSFALTGCLGLVRTWLAEGNDDSPEYMAQLACHLVVSSMKSSFGS